jgi:hypothetical protein
MEKDVEQLLRIKATKNVFCLFFTLLSRKRLYNMNSDIKSADIEKHIDNIRLHNPRKTTKIQIKLYHCTPLFSRKPFPKDSVMI